MKWRPLGADAAFSAHGFPVLTGIYLQASPFEVRADPRSDLRRMLANSPGEYHCISAAHGGQKTDRRRDLVTETSVALDSDDRFPVNPLHP